MGRSRNAPYGSASDGDLAVRGARVRLNREVLARFRRGECGPLEVTTDDLGKVSCPVIALPTWHAMSGWLFG